MMRYPLLPEVFDLARVTIQFSSPVTVGTGQGDDLVDSVCLADANGLPTIPGTSIAGVLRHALADGDPDEDDGIRRVLGYQDRDPLTGDPRGQSSQLWTSWAQVHDGLDQPVPFRAEGERAKQLNDDGVVAALRTGVFRDHVRISAKGVVADRGKFDELLVPAGARFTFELGLAALEAELNERFCLDSLLACLDAPSVRLGGRTRRGLGDFRLVRVLHRRFNLRRDREAWAALPRDIADGDPAGMLKAIDLPTLLKSAARRSNTADVVLTPEDFFLWGRGDVAAWREAADIPEKRLTNVDIVPYTERAITWAKGRGQFGERAKMVLPATSIKGALRHRVAFHARAMAGQWMADGRTASEVDLDAPKLPTDDAGRRAVEALFGSAKDDGEGVPGRVFIPDVRRPAPKAATLQHVSLDRFTGGPMDGMLFGESVAWGGASDGGSAIEFGIWVQRADDLDACTREAFRRAVEDMVQGRLALGAASSRGHGYFKGKVTWSEDWRGEK